MFQFLPIDILFLTAAILSLFLAVTVLFRRLEQGGWAFAATMFAAGIWLFFRVLEGISLDIPSKIFWSKFEYIGITTLPIFYIIFAYQYSRKDSWIKPWVAVLLSLIPMTTLVLAVTNEQHGLIWSDVYFPNPAKPEHAVYEHGFFFWVHSAYGYVLIFLGVVQLLSTFLNYSKENRVQMVILITATLIPWVSNILYLLGLSPIEGLDLTPLGLVISGVVLAISIYRHALFEFVPFAHNIIFENMHEGILVVDTDCKTVDINPAAQELLNLEKAKSLNQPLDVVLGKYPKLVQVCKNPEDDKFEIQLDDEQKFIQVSTSTIIPENEPEGRLIVLQDISQRKQLELFELEQRKFAEALSHMAATLNSTLEFEVVLTRMLEIIHDVVPHDSANIALINEEKHVKFAKLRGYENQKAEAIMRSLDYNIKETPTFRVMLEDKHPFLVKDTETDPNWVQNPDVAWIRSYLGCPIIVEDEVIGFINLDSYTPDFYTEEHVQRIQVFANEAAIAIRNAQVVEELMQRNQDVTMLYEVGMALTEGLDFEGVLNGLKEQLLHFPVIDVFFLAIQNEEDSSIDFFVIDTSNKLKKKSIKRSNGDFDHFILEKRRTLYLSRIESKEIIEKLQEINANATEEIHTYLGIPLIQNKRVVGVLSVLSKEEDAFTNNQIRLMETIAWQVAIKLQNVHMYNSMKELAIIDELTGIYNRRFFYLTAPKEINRAIRYQKSLTIMLVDIDHFKEVNDHFGHIAGDRVLQKLTQVIQKQLRGSDVFARYGGEEFLVLLPDTSGEDALVAAERIRKKVEELQVDFNQEQISITISLGVTQLTGERKTLQELISVVDQALYAAKQNGRNRVEFLP